MGKRILICCNVYPPKFIGGAELIAHDHAKTLKRLGHDVVIFAGDTEGHGERHSIRRDVYEGLTVYRVTLTWKDFQPSYINFTHRRVEEHFKNILDSFSPDIVHFHNIIGLSVGIIHLAKKKGLRTILTLHDHWGFCYKNTLLKNGGEICRDYSKCAECMPFISENSYKNIPIDMRKDFFAVQFKDVDVFISPSQYLADAYIRAGFPKEKFRVIWNGTDVRRFANISKIDAKGCVRFTFIGYFGAHKGINILLNTLPFIGKDHHFKVNLVGDGELLAKYRQLVKSMGFDNLVKFWGRIDNIERAYSETDVLILPSIWPENQPVTITEAMASRIPVIASNIGGNPELIEDGRTGCLFEPGNSRDLADKMLEFISKPDEIKTFGENAYKKIANNTFEHQIFKIIKIYDEDLSEIKEIKDEMIVACRGHQVNHQCIQAMRSILNKSQQIPLRFLLFDWLREDQLLSAKLLWIVDRNTDINDAAIALTNKLSLLVPEDTAKLKNLCIKGNCGLYYKDAIEAEACLEYLIKNEVERIALGECGLDFFQKNGLNKEINS